MDSIYTFEFVVMGILLVIMFLIYRFTKGKKRYILLCILGDALMLAILIGTIIVGARNLTIFMAVLLIGYLASQILIWRRIVNRKGSEDTKQG